MTAQDYDGRDVELMTVGVVLDSGLCSDGLPRDEWQEHAGGAVSGDEQYWITLAEPEWNAAPAAEHLAAVSAVAQLMRGLSDSGPALFDALTTDERQTLRQAAQGIRQVAWQLDSRTEPGLHG